MIVDLPSTTTTEVSRRLVDLRNSVGAMAMGRVLTLLIIVGEDGADPAIKAANDATRQHPARIVVLVSANRRGANRLDAQIRVGGDAGASEIVVLRLYGALADHGDSVVTPLLLPDSPIVAWWPQDPPADVAGTAIGAMAHRRITDASTAGKPSTELRRRAQHYQPGDTDLTWARITRWRGVLAASLDQPPYEEVEAAMVTGEGDDAGADLLAGWLAHALQVPVTRARSGQGTGLVSVRLQRASGPIELALGDGNLATLQAPGQPVRLVALSTPGLSECLADDLRRLDADEIYACALTKGLPLVGRRSGSRRPADAAGDAAGGEGGGKEGGKDGAPRRSGPAVSTRALAQRTPSEEAPSDSHLHSSVDDALQRLDTADRRVHPSPDAVAEEVAAAIDEAVAEAVAARGVAHVALTGGSMGAATVAALAARDVDRSVWRSVHLWWGDERFVPAGDGDRNDQQADDAGLGRLPVPPAQVHRAPAGSDEADLAAAATAYALELAAHAPPVGNGADGPRVAVPAFDVMLLGMGPDGHVASLFPGRPELEVTDATTVPVTGSPKPPPLRVSLTVPALRAARRVWFVVTGADKAATVARAASRRDDPDLPASWVRGARETIWWLDAAAAETGDAGKR